MSYYFRIHKGADDQAPETGWNETGVIKDNNTGIQSIDDTIDQIPASGKVGTSIPTPLARMYLFNTAFEALKDGGVKNKTYEQLVSDCLDLLQFLFEKGQSPAFKFYNLNIAATIKTLRESGNYGDKILADSLDLSIGQNKLFDTSLFIIEYDGIVLGGTSPFTMVYTSPNIRREIRRQGRIDEFSSNQKQEFFSHTICPIEDRPKEFKDYLRQLYNHVTANTNNIGADKQPFFMYITKKLGMAEMIGNFNELYPAVKTQEGASISTLYAEISYNDAPVVMDNSDFLMAPTVPCGRPPLVLPTRFVPSQSMTWIYTDSPWNENTRIIDSDCRTPVEERRLPKNGLDSSHESSIRYPWLSNYDFFNDNLIDLGYVINTEKFIYPSCDEDITFLLPIKKLYFDYFTVEDMKKYLSISGKKTRKDEKNRISYDEVTFSLAIPLKSSKGSIVLERTYKKNSSEYGIVQMSNPIGMGVFPFYKIVNGADAVRDPKKEKDYYCEVKNEYSVYLFSKPSSDGAAKKPSLKFYNCDKRVEIFAPAVERTRNAVGVSTVYSIRPDLERIGDAGLTAFDFIELNNLTQSVDSAILIPDLKKEESFNNDKQAVFAVDFGTSNTHVSYWDYETGKPRPLEVTPDLQQMVLLNKPVLDNRNIRQYRSKSALRRAADMDDFLREFVPPIIGNDSINKGVSYPIKTATLQGKKPLGNPILFGNVNIGFDIDNEEVTLTDDFVYKTNLKWALQEARPKNDIKCSMDAENRVRLFCEETLWLLKNILVLKGMSNSGITLKYFYPESMMREDKDNFKKIWVSSCRDVFKKCGFNYDEADEAAVKSMPESVAPYYSLLKRNGDLLNFNSINIDIGGGTTDIFFFDRGMEQGVKKGFDSSVFFAANDIWGESYPSVENPKNGFVQYMKDKVKSLGDNRLEQLYENFTGKNDPASLSSFFFKHEDFRFGEIVKNVKPFKFLLFLHYASIIYYITDMIKCIRTRELSRFTFPRVMSFTGKGSEYLKLLTPNPEHITRLTQALFDSFGIAKEELSKFRVQYPDNPKTLTADGGVYSCKSTEVTTDFVSKDDVNYYDNDEDSSKKCVYQLVDKYLLGFDIENSSVVDVSIRIRDINADRTGFEKRIMAKFGSFVDCLFGHDRLNAVAKSIGIEIVQSYKDLVIENAQKSLHNHLSRFLDERKDKEDDELDGTLFFLTLKNSIIDMSYVFYEKLNVK